ncbi:MAG: acyl-CoA/acyl-ACP dehydrogenase [Actinobacteria bacterium]|nr:acyl-CoA/acyl-ACP dehydrogenase [Actinomycetota bacterium]
MNFAFTEDQMAFRDAVRTLLEKECPPEVVRARWEGKPTEVWASLSDMGVVGMTAPEDAGGLGMDELDLVLVLEECGRAALPEPIVEHAAVVIPALREGGGKTAQRWLPMLAAGEAVATAGLGEAPLVPDADRAALLLDDHDGCLHAVEMSACELTPLDSIDRGRPLFAAAWYAEKDTKVEADFELAFDRAALGASAQLLGLADRMISMTVEHSKEREQFGRAIGSFQAVQHRLADALLRLEFARPVVYRAAYAVARPGECAPADRSLRVSMAKAYAGDAATDAARAALQIHGAIGYSWEFDLHLFMKRAWSLAAAYGDGSFHRRRVGDWLQQREDSDA